MSTPSAFPDIKVGVIGFDTSHVPAFARLLNDPGDPHHVPGARIVAGYPSFSPDLAGSVSRVHEYTREVRDNFGVRICASIEEVVAECDAILLESVDGRRHLEEARPILIARNPVFIDKPLAADYASAVAIARLSQENGCPIFSSSSLRFDANIAALKEDAELGRVLACDAFSPATLEATNPGLFWYGVHGVETLYSLMGRGCQRVLCRSTDDYDVVLAWWPDDRLATLRGTRAGAHDYGATVFGENKVVSVKYSREVPLYAGLMKQIVKFFQTGQAPVAMEETLEIMAFMQAALRSGQQNREVALNEIREQTSS